MQTRIDNTFDDFARSHASRADALRKLRPFTEPCRELLDAEGLW